LVFFTIACGLFSACSTSRNVGRQADASICADSAANIDIFNNGLAEGGYSYAYPEQTASAVIVPEAHNGSAGLKITLDRNAWSGAGIGRNPTDLSGFRKTGSLVFSVKGSISGVTIGLVDSAKDGGSFHSDMQARKYSRLTNDWQEVCIPLADFGDSAQSWDEAAGRQKDGTVSWKDIVEVSFAIGPIPGNAPFEFTVTDLRIVPERRSTSKTTELPVASKNPAEARTIGGRRLMGYYPSWNPAYKAENIPYDNLTHIFHAFIGPAPDGGLSVPAGFLEKELIIRARTHGVKVIVSVGGADETASRNFHIVASSESFRQRFAAELEKFCRQNGYDGVDLDWEFPADAIDRQNEVLLTAAIRKKFDSSPAPAPRWTISKAAPSGDWYGRWSDYDGLTPLMDFYNLMAYDFHGGWSDHSGPNAPLFGGNDPKDSSSCAEAAAYMTNTRKVPASKLNLGLAFFGHKFENSSDLYDSCESDKCRTRYMNYYEIVPLLENTSWQVRRDESSRVPWLKNRTGPGIVVYDDEQSLREKIRWQAGLNLGGVFIWDISADFYDGTNRLLPAVLNAVEGR
jgi:chitinase